MTQIYTFRGHISPVLCLVNHVSSDNSSLCIYSGDLNGQLRSWRIPNSNLDPYDAFDSNIIGPLLCGHTNSIWSLSLRVSFWFQILLIIHMYFFEFE